MDVISVLIFIFLTLILSTYKGVSIAYAFSFGLLLLILLAHKKGFKFIDLLYMIGKGAKRCLLIVKIFILIGIITAVWRASGTVSLIVYYGIEFMNPNYFILYSFLLSCIVSVLLGTSFGTVGTIGIVLMVMAKSGSVNMFLLGGAVISGAYFGDRCSPMSSSANLVATLTETNLHRNIRNMIITSILPFIISIVVYTILSLKNPMQISNNLISQLILDNFNLRLIVVLPALIILILSMFKVDVKLSMLISIVLGIAIAITIQKENIIDIFRFMFVGYSINSNTSIVDIFAGGGILSMLKISIIVLISTACSGLLEGTNMLYEIEYNIDKIKNRYGRFATTVFISIITASFGCTQTLSIILTNQLVKKQYKKDGVSKYELAVDIEDTSVVLSPLIPWNIAGAVPAATLGVGMGFIPYAVYLYIFPITSYITKKYKII